ncbi:MAG TPA: tetratricopeptide repeat protein, partial [Vicinamibacteria bacterium]|nr:tetratricopeptide repeat protein [Vicinamibacteria bacterium]
MKTTALPVLAGLFGLVSACARGEPAPPPKLESSLGDEVDRGIELYEKRQYAEAVTVLERAVQTSEGDSRAWEYLGLARLQLNRVDESRNAFQRALELDEHSANAYFGLGLADGHSGELQESIQKLKRAVELDPSHAYAHYHLGLAYNAAGKPDLTLLHLNRFLELAPEAPEAGQVRDLVSRLR